MYMGPAELIVLGSLKIDLFAKIQPTVEIFSPEYEREIYAG